MARKRGGGGDEGGGANWMDTYGDLVTLLLCFFVLLFASSSMDAAKFQALAGAFSGRTVTAIEPLTPEDAMARPISMIQRSPDDESDGQEELPLDVAKAMADEAFENLVVAVGSFISENDLKAGLEVDYSAYTLVMHFDDNIFFSSGKADIIAESLPILDNMAKMFDELSGRFSMIRIEGHTDNVPINTAQFPSNWELSVFRAAAALHFLLDTGLVDVSKITCGGFAEQQPIASNDTPEGRAANRRVDFVLEGFTPNAMRAGSADILSGDNSGVPGSE